MAIRTLTLRGLPDATLDRIRARAAANHRSLNGELLAILDAVAAEVPRSSAATAVVRETAGVPYTTAGRRHQSPIESVDREALALVCRRHHIRWLAVFGSYSRGEARPDSDVDVVVEFAPGRTPGLGMVRVAEALRPVFGGRHVDLLTRRGLSPRLRDPILSSARTLHSEE